MRKFIFTFIIGFIFIINGCGDKNEATGDKKDDTKKKEMNQEQDMQQNEEVKKKDETNLTKEDASKLNELGMTAGLPPNFPSDVPQPKNGKVLGSLNSSEGTVVTFESNDNVMNIVNFYKEEMKKNGYAVTEEGETLISDKGGLINWKKDSKEVQLMLGYDKDKNITSLVITYK